LFIIQQLESEKCENPHTLTTLSLSLSHTHTHTHTYTLYRLHFNKKNTTMESKECEIQLVLLKSHTLSLFIRVNTHVSLALTHSQQG